MNQSLSSDDDTPNSQADPAPSAGDLEAIRDLLFGQEKRQLEVLQERMENPGLHARDVSGILPQAVEIASARDQRLAVALTPAVESALKESVKRDPSALVSAIFPIIGPAIRKSIAETFAKLVQSLNQTLDDSFSARGLRWRLEAARTGKSFGEVVLAHTLVYRVEQVFLIHKKTGLLLLHLIAPNIRAQDASMVSGMLTAIQDFVQDSFRVSPGEALHTLQIGELNVWVESSPLVNLAAVIRGQAPYEFRALLQGALEKIHEEQGAALTSFDGETTPLEAARSHLEPCLEARFAEPAKKKSSAKLPIIAGLVLVLLAVWVILSLREKRHWSGFLERLKQEPGIVVTETGKRSGKYFVSGLRDALAVDPATLFAQFKLRPDQVVGRWEPYQALNPELILKRAEQQLRPPPGVVLRQEDGVLIAAGHGPSTWIENARARAVLVPGIQSYDDTGLADETQSVLTLRQREVEQTVIFFEEGVRLVPGQDSTLGTLARQLVELSEISLGGGRRVSVSVVGHSDKTGTEEQNLRLSRQRAEHVTSLLVADGVPAPLLTATGVGARESGPINLPDQDPTKSRRVTFRVQVEQAHKP